MIKLFVTSKKSIFIYIVIALLIIFTRCDNGTKEPTSKIIVQQEIDITGVKSVIVKTYGSDRILTLKGNREESFLKELKAVLKRDTCFDSNFPQSTGVTVGPEYQIILIFNNGNQREFEVYGRTVLYDRINKNLYQFYMGLMITQWLEERPTPQEK